MLRIVTILLAFLVSSCQEPDFLDTRGNGYRYEELNGKWLVVNYWATWCAPCIKEIPELNKLAEEHKDRVLVFGVNFDQPIGEEIQAQVAKMKIEFPVFSLDPSSYLGIHKPEVLPTTFVFTPDGKLHSTLVGPQTEETLLNALL